jgi:hypothetical protein
MRVPEIIGVNDGDGCAVKCSFMFKRAQAGF